MSGDDEMTIPEAATLLGLDRTVVYRAVKSGRIKGRQVSAKLWLVTRDEVLAYPLTRAAGEKRGRKKAAPTDL